MQEIGYGGPVCVINQQNSLLYNTIARKYNILVPYKDTYLQLSNRIHTSFVREVIFCHEILMAAREVATQ